MNLKRIVAWLLLGAMLLGLVSVAAFAAESVPNMMVGSGAISEEEKELPEQGFWGQISVRRADVRTITFRDTLADAPDYVWDLSAARNKSVVGWYRNGEMVVAADGKVALNENSAMLFAGMNCCTQINFGDAVDTSYVKNMSCMFRDCSQLKALDLSCFDTSNVTDMSFMFYGCKALEKLDVSGFRTEKVTAMRGMFTVCRNLESADLSSFHTPELTDMKAMFDSCMKLKNVVLTNFDTSKVTNMQNLFGGCRSLEELDLNSFRTPAVETMSNMFAYCTGLQKLAMKNATTENTKGMAQMFLHVGQLTLDCSDEGILKAYEKRNYC